MNKEKNNHKTTRKTQKTKKKRKNKRTTMKKMIRKIKLSLKLIGGLCFSLEKLLSICVGVLLHSFCGIWDLLRNTTNQKSKSWPPNYSLIWPDSLTDQFMNLRFLWLSQGWQRCSQTRCKCQDSSHQKHWFLTLTELLSINLIPLELVLKSIRDQVLQLS